MNELKVNYQESIALLHGKKWSIRKIGANWLQYQVYYCLWAWDEIVVHNFIFEILS